MMRILGKNGMASAYKGENEGFAGPDVVKAWKMYKELCEMDPFQEGFLTAKTGESVGFFHDGKAAFHLQASAWVVGVGRTYAANKQGYLMPSSVGFSSPRFKVARVRLTTSLAVFETTAVERVGRGSVRAAERFATSNRSSLRSSAMIRSGPFILAAATIPSAPGQELASE
jgi:hypothetical protein